MKKIISLMFILLMVCLIGCSKPTQYEDFDSYEVMDQIFEDWKSSRDDIKYLFIDCRSTTDRKKACHPYFDYIENKVELKGFVKGYSKNTPIILMGQNENDTRPNEMKEYLVSKGFTNIAIYLTGFENYLTKEGFTPKTGCATDCGCN